nr:MAG TPA: hypothetical protein [Caudoviricetes sp.]
MRLQFRILQFRILQFRILLFRVSILVGVGVPIQTALPLPF